MTCIWSSWYHCQPIISASENPEWFILMEPTYPNCPGKKPLKTLRVLLDCFCSILQDFGRRHASAVPCVSWASCSYLLHYVWNTCITHNMQWCFRMDMVVNAGKSRKNVEANIILAPDAWIAIDLLIETRSVVGVPPSNVIYLWPAHCRYTYDWTDWFARNGSEVRGAQVSWAHYISIFENLYCNSLTG